MSSTRWLFEEYDPNTANIDGKIADLVKNLTLDNPGILGVGAIGQDRPSDEAGLLVREAVQNAWDNAIERATFEGVKPDCQLEFRFLELRGREKAAFVETAALQELANRSEQVSPVATGFSDEQTYEKLNDPDHPLRVMQLIEVSGTTGMYGPWVGMKSRLGLALLNVGFTKKAVGAGGSYGYGKAALIRCSGVRVVAAYTAFNREVTCGEDADEDTTDRRFIAVNYWGEHEVSGEEFTGWARFGRGPEPFEGDEADEMARDFQIDVRDPSKTSGIGGIGTTLVVLDPIVEPKDVLLAVERYWWPALTRTKKDWTLEISIKDYSGEELRPSPRTNPDLAPFVEAYQWLQTNPEDKKRNKFLGKAPLPRTGGEVEQGVVSLIWDDTDDSWTWPSEDDETDHCSLIALCRNPRMVVGYLKCGERTPAPFLRGVFVNDDDESNDLLTETEGGMHLLWATDGRHPGVNKDAYWLAGQVLNKTKQKVRDARAGLIRPARTPSKSHLPVLARFMKDFFGGDRGTKKKVENLPEHRTISIQFTEPAEPEFKAGGVCSVAALSFEPMPEVAEDAPFRVQIKITYRIQEDGSGGATWPCKVKPLAGFTQRSTGDAVILEGTLDGTVIIHVESDPHDEEWTGEWHPVASRVDQEGEPSDGQ
jgi:hypothetical protein